jgi:DNA polymerase I
MNNDLLVLIDGSSYLYRAFHALPPLVNSKGQPTGAIYGVLNMVKKLVSDYDPKYLAVIFDAKGKTFRDDMYPEYKANRPPMPDELRSQIEPLHEIFRALHYPLLCVPGVEADDVIGTLAKQAEKAGMKTLISTGDKDMAQLVNSDVTLINTMSNKISDREGVIEKFGIPPELIIDYLALIGDTSDNVPGVSKVGPKTAVKWLTEYSTLDGIVENADGIKGKVGENLRASLDQLSLSKELVTIKCDVELSYKISELTPGEPDQHALINLYKDFEFKHWLKALLEDDEIEKPKVQNKKYSAVLDQKSLDLWIEKLKGADLIAFDTETTSLNYMNAEIVGLSFCVKPDEACYIPVAHNYAGAPEQLNREDVLKQLKPILESETLKKTGHNLKYDKEVLANHGIKLKGIAFDTMLESYVIDSTANRHDMDTLALKYLGHNNIKFEDVAGKGVKQITFDQVSLEVATDYAAEDADISLQLHLALWPRIQDDEKLLYVFENIELPLINVLSYVERNGVLIDSEMLNKQSQELEKRLAELEEEIHTLSGEPFNVNSPKQLQVILYEKLNIPIIKKTPKGQASTAEPVLQELAHDYELPKLILEYRSLSKLKSTYTDKLPEEINAKTGRIHTSFHQAVAGTGRLSSSNPNLQNIPIRTKEGRRIREAFIARPNHELVAADYSQIELRIMAHLSKDKGLIDAFAHGLDIHKATAAQVFGEKLEDVTSDQRRKAKAINFGLIYGMSAFGLAKQLGVERAAAQAYIDSYFNQYPGVHEYMEATRKKAHELGFVETIFGRRLYLPEINARNINRQKASERAAINAPMQGTAADIIKIAMINVYKWLAKSKVDAKLILQVHDELVLEVSNEAVEETKGMVDELMSNAAKLDVPLVVDVGVGNNWNDAH